MNKYNPLTNAAFVINVNTFDLSINFNMCPLRNTILKTMELTRKQHQNILQSSS